MSTPQPELAGYRGGRVLITGGLGFIGSNVAHALVSLGAEVSIIDTLDPRYGGNLHNLEGIKDKVQVTIGDIRDEKLVRELVRDKDVIFNFAAQVSYIDSAKIPHEDLDVNAKGHLTLPEACREVNPGVKILFSSSRLALGKIVENPVTEKHPTHPVSLYGVHKLTAEKYHYLYFKNHGIRSVIFRLTNPYGERQQIKHSKYSLPGWFMRLAMEGKPITVFGDGGQIRDYIHISDLVPAILLAGISPKTDGEIYNCGSGATRLFREMAECVVKTVGSGEVAYVPWPKDYEQNETGDCPTDISKLCSAIPWSPSVTLEEGVRRMVEYYKEHKEHYLA